MVVQRGYTTAAVVPRSRLRGERAGHFFDVMTHGFGQMPDYSAQVTAQDRWAIVAYIRALQLSQNATVERRAGRGSRQARWRRRAGGSGRSRPQHD